MAKDAYYFKHDANASEDLKCKGLRRKYGWAGQGWYWKIIELLRTEDGYHLPYSELCFESLASEFQVEVSQVEEFLADCIKRTQLFVLEDDYFFSERLCRDMVHLEEKREKTRRAGLESAKKRWGKDFKESKTDDNDPDKFIKGKYGHLVQH